ncbi:tail fiber domain-containing protein [Escherichia coli]
MSAGTLKLTNNSTAVVGTSTLFTTDLKPGDFITATIGGVLYTLPVDSVTSNTAATLVSPFTGPTTTGAAWAAVPRKTMNQVTAELVNQSTAAIRALLAEKGNWAKFYTAPGDITMQFADNVAPVSGPGWQKMAGMVSSSQQWRGNLPAAANLNAYGPTPDFTGIWNRSSNTNTTAEYGFPEDSGQGVLEVFAGGRYGGLQRYTVSTSGNVYIRSLTGAWNGTDGPWSGWLPAGVKPLIDLGMGWSAITTLSSFDWQQFDALSGQICRVAIENMSNLPPGITFTNGTGVYVLVNGTSSGGARFSLEIIPDTATDPNYKIYKVLVVGAKGARTFSVRQVFTNTDVVPMVNGGTGATTPAGGRTALGLGNSATRNVGSASGTVAAGDDSRLNTVGGKTGGSITSSITVGGPVMTAIDQGASLANKQGHVLVSRILTGSTPRCDALMYPFIDGNLVRQAAWAITSDNGTDQKTVVFNWANGALSVPGQVYPGSDIRHKTNIREVQNALEAVCNVRGVVYDKKDGGTEVGLIAQEVEQYCPEAIYESERKFFDDTVITDFKSLNVSGFSAAFAFAAIKELKVEVDELREQVALYHAELQSLVEENNAQQLEIEALKSNMEELKKMVEGLINK